MNDSDDRLTAAKHLVRVDGGAFSTRLLAGGARRGVRSRVLGVLRWQRLLDRVLARHCSRPLAKLDPEVRTALRLGLFETTVLGVPHAVATDAAVHLTRRLGKKSASGMVNAVLRRAPASWQRTIDTAPPDVAQSHPDWLYRRWLTHFGDTAVSALMAANQKPAPLCLWFVDDTALDEARSHAALEPHPWCANAWTTTEATPELISMLTARRAYAQDAASQAVAHITAALAPDSARIADLCSAPGGKSALLARLARPRTIVAADLNPKRARLIAELSRHHGSFPVIVNDAGAPALRAGSFDIVLLDAPCSGTGTLRRHPELRWRLTPDSLADRQRLQRALLTASLPLVAEGGALVYSTCSIEAEENEHLIDELGDTVAAVDLERHLPHADWITTEAGGARILPAELNDGFTMHALRVRCVTN